MNKVLEFIESERADVFLYVLSNAILGVALVFSWTEDGLDYGLLLLILGGSIVFVFLATIVCLIAFEIPIWVRHWIDKEPESATDWAAVLDQRREEREKAAAEVLAQRSEVIEERDDNGVITYRILHENDANRGWICSDCRLANTALSTCCVRCGGTTRKTPRVLPASRLN